MNAASTNGALRIADSATVSGHSPPISPLRTIIVITWLGAIAKVHSQARPRDNRPSAALRTTAAGSPMLQNCVLSQASRLPLNA